MKMRFLIVLGMFASTISNAQVTSTVGETYREWNGTVQISNGDLKILEIKVNSNLRVDRYGDPEIEHHGFFNYVVTGSVIEDGKTCAFETLLMQKPGQELSTPQALETQADRAGSIKLCSGLILEIPSAKALLKSDSTFSNLKSQGIAHPIGSGNLQFTALRIVAESDCRDPWHCY